MPEPEIADDCTCGLLAIRREEGEEV